MVQQVIAELAAADAAKEQALAKAAAAKAAWQQAEAEATAAEATWQSAFARILSTAGPRAELQPAASNLRPPPSGFAAPLPQPGGTPGCTPAAAGEGTGEAAVPDPRASVAVRHVCQAHLASSACSTACTSNSSCTHTCAAGKHLSG